MSSSRVISLCPACKMGYILALDLHIVCEGCLGAEHARQAMAPQSSCPFCKLLPAEEKQHRFKLFSSTQEESQPTESYSLDEFPYFSMQGRFWMCPPLKMRQIATELLPLERESWSQSCHHRVFKYRPPPFSRQLALSFMRCRILSRGWQRCAT